MARDRPVLTAALVAGAVAGGAGAIGLALAGAVWSAAAVALLALAALVGGWTVLGHHFDALGRLEAAIAGLPAGGAPAPAMAEAGAEIARIYATARALQPVARTAVADRLAAIVAALPTPVLAVTESGLVSLVNGPARAVLGAEAVTVGTSLYDALHRAPVVAARTAARAAGRPVEITLETVDGRPLIAHVADLGDHGGAVIAFAAPADGAPPGLDQALDLHGRPAAGPAVPETPLDQLALVALDTETTGLDPARDRVVSIGAVRMAGGRLLRTQTFDRLVRPDVAIPARSTAIHGIDDATVAEAPPIGDVLPALHGFLGGAVAAGHNIGFDLAILAAEAARAGIVWGPPPALCTMQLAAALDPGRTDLDLSDVAVAHGVAVTGRHTALGDALVNAELLAAMIPRLAANGVTTLGEAMAFAARARRVRRRQAEAGW